MVLTLEQALEQAQLLEAGLADAASRGFTPSIREATILALAKGFREAVADRQGWQGSASEFLHEARQRLGLSRAEMATRIGCTDSYLWKLEHGAVEPGIAKAMAIAEGYRVPLQDLAALFAKAT